MARHISSILRSTLSSGLALGLGLAHARPASSQTTTATLQGVVTDASRAMLPGVTVTLRDVNTGFARTTTTQRTGAYVLSFVPRGSTPAMPSRRARRPSNRSSLVAGWAARSRAIAPTIS